MGFKQIGGALAVSIFSISAIATPAFQPTTLAEAATKVKLNKTECTLTVGETTKLKLKGAKAMKFVSSNKKVVKAYSSGKIKAIKAGTATISVYDEQDKVYKCKVTVKKKAEVKDYGDVDLEGMEIFIRDWWHSSIDSEDIPGPANEYEETLYKYRQEMMDKYNFKIREVSISDWGSANTDFIDYVTNGGDDNNYVFTLHLDQNVTKALYSGMMYDLSTLDCLDFSEEKFTKNMLHQKFSIGSGIYAFYAGEAYPRTGVYFNKQLLRNCGIDPDSIYDAQKNGTWTWEMFEELIDKCQQDIDGDGIDDIYGFSCLDSVMTIQSVISNGGSFIEKNKKGKYIYNLESAETIEALQWCVDLFNKYEERELEGLSWDAYMDEWREGKSAFLIDQGYIATPDNLFEVTDFDMGFVMFPKGPKAKNYATEYTDNIYVIPACYDAERAWKIAFAWNLYTNPAPGYEDYSEFLESAKCGNFDRRAIKETLPKMLNPKYGVLTYYEMIDGLEIGPQLTWSIVPGFTGEVTELIDQIRDKWKEVIEDTNAMMK